MTTDKAKKVQYLVDTMAGVDRLDEIPNSWVADVRGIASDVATLCWYHNTWTDEYTYLEKDFLVEVETFLLDELRGLVYFSNTTNTSITWATFKWRIQHTLYTLIQKEIEPWLDNLK